MAVINIDIIFRKADLLHKSLMLDLRIFYVLLMRC